MRFELRMWAVKPAPQMNALVTCSRQAINREDLMWKKIIGNFRLRPFRVKKKPAISKFKPFSAITAMGFLFPRLPDELGRECLVRVELNSHHNLRRVCKSWSAALKDPSFYERRKVLKISEQRICFIEEIEGVFKGVTVYDPERYMTQNSCKNLPPLPIEIDGTFRCCFVKQKLVLIPENVADFASNYVWLYDFPGMKWKQGAKMTRGMNTFASAADEHGGLVYVAGGSRSFYLDGWHPLFGNPVSSASVYIVDEDKWEDLPDMNDHVGIFPQGVFSDGKFYAMESLDCFEVFDSYTKSWTFVKNEFNMEKSCFVTHYVSSFGHVYCFCNRRLIEYDYSQNKVQIVGSLPGESPDRDVRFAIMVGNKIFVRTHDNTLGFCMLPLPSEIGEAFKWIETQGPPGLPGLGIDDAAATLDL